MIRGFLIKFGIFSIGAFSALSIAGQSYSASVKLSAISQEDVRRCGMNISTPEMSDIYEKLLHFDCTGKQTMNNYEYKVIVMDFQYDPNGRRVGDNITFYVSDMNLSRSVRSLPSDFFGLDDEMAIDKLSGKMIRHKNKTYCGLTVTTRVSPIRGSNWTGWMAEDTYSGKSRPNCGSPKEYTSRYRCVSMMIGNENMSAAMNKVCLLRKYESNIQRGLSYDIFDGMIKTIRFEK